MRVSSDPHHWLLNFKGIENDGWWRWEKESVCELFKQKIREIISLWIFQLKRMYFP